MKNLLLVVVVATCACVAMLGGELRAGVSYDAVTDFSSSKNPSGAWSYGVLSAMIGGVFTADSSESPQCEGAIEVWTSGGSEVIKNMTGSEFAWYSNVMPADQLLLAPRSLPSDLRWVAPSSDTYNVAGLFERLDSSSKAPVSIAVIQNGTSVLFRGDDFITFHEQRPFELSGLSLQAGDTLDFYAVATTSDSYTGTGVAVTVAPVPEPSAMTALLAAATTFAAYVWRRKQRCLGIGTVGSMPGRALQSETGALR